MEIKVNIGYREILELIFQLPEKDIQKLMKTIQKKENQKQVKTTTIDFQKLLLQAPTWSDKEYSDFLEGEKHFKQFRSI
ncbi:MAG: hypothetical protein ACOYOV_07300 [Bacteroidales bacterium]